MYNLDILIQDQEFNILKKGEKSLYNTDNQDTASQWVKDPTKTTKINSLPTKNGISVHNGKSVKNTWRQDSIGYMHNNANNIQYNTQYVGLYSTVFGSAHGVEITKENIFRITSLFCSRKSVKGDWINWYDEYLAPNEVHDSFEQFKHDSIVYSLFESKSNQSSLRQVEYKNQLWDVKNEFFWMSVEKIKELADQNGYDELYNDARTSSDRYVHKLLFGEERIYDKLSPDAKAVLDKATELVERSIELRQVMANDENHLNSWDAGYAQLKLVWKEYFQEDFKQFRQLYKTLEDRMRPLVYELGFLKK